MPSIILGGTSHSFAIFVIIDITLCKFLMLFFGGSERFIYLCINMLTPLPVEQRAQGEPFFYIMDKIEKYNQKQASIEEQIAVMGFQIMCWNHGCIALFM